ncbi:MAG: hypothetical protein D6748_04800 [Calditrichaeota bacterium]|nr:MAG: hypothetical protein D6748_04800 [Calditrichota bacterium]
MKIGIGSNLTMDVTLNPDFGQVELDPAVVNLTAFETFFREKRPFFIEGAGIFSFGNRGATNDWTFNYNPPTFFYSRRIGRPPQLEPLHSGEINSPANSTILSAVKISGKTYSDWEIGVLQAFTAREYAEIDSEGVRLKEEVEPFTSYTVVRTFKHFMTNRAGLGLIGTSTIRDLRNRNEIESLRDKAYVFGLDGYWFLGKQRRWVINGWWGASHVTGSKEAITELQQNSQHYFQRPDFEYTSLDSNKTELNGWTGRLALNKEQGNFYLNAAIAVNSPGFESNDLGFHSRGNVINQHLVLGYRWFQPGKIFRNAAWHVSNFRTFDFDGNKTAEGFMSFFHGRLLNYTGIFGRAGYFRRTLDISRTRGGPAMEKPAGFFSGISISSDSRKDFILELKGNYGASARGGWRYGFGSEMEWKPGSRFFLEVEPEYFRDYSPAQYIDTIDDPAAQHTYGKRYIFGILDQKQLSASVRVNYTFTPQLSLQGFFQPLISSGKYTDIKELAHPGGYDFIHYGKDQGSSIKLRDDEYEIDPDGTGQHLFYISQPDFNFKSLRGTVVLRWEFAPGSTLFFVWTHDRAEDENSGEFRFGRDLRRLLDQKADNIFLVKFSYWWNP